MDDSFDDTLSRSELIKVLNDIGVSIPEDTKMPDTTLEKRLRQALDAMQLAEQHISSGILNTSSLRIWPAGRPLFDAISRQNIDLRQMYMDAAGDVLYKNVLIDIRETCMSLGQIFDSGLLSAIIQTQCAILLRVSGPILSSRLISSLLTIHYEDH